MGVAALPPPGSGKKLSCCGIAGLFGLLVARTRHQRCHRLRRSEKPRSALGVCCDRVPGAFRLEGGYATLAASREACVSAASAPFAAGKEVAVDVPATMTTLANTHVTATMIALRTRKLVAMGVAALPPPGSGKKLSCCGIAGLFGLLVVPKNPEAHSVSAVTGYQLLFGLMVDMQHLLPAAKHAFPQHPPPSPQGKKLPLTFLQQ